MTSQSHPLSSDSSKLRTITNPSSSRNCKNKSHCSRQRLLYSWRIELAKTSMCLLWRPQISIQAWRSKQLGTGLVRGITTMTISLGLRLRYKMRLGISKKMKTMLAFPEIMVYSRSKESTKRSSIWESLWSLITLLKEARWTWSSSQRPTWMSTVPQTRWRLQSSIKRTKITSWWRVSASHHLGLASHLQLKDRLLLSKLIKKEWMSQVSLTFTRSRDSWQGWSLTWSRKRVIWNSRSSSWKRSLHLKKRRYPMRHCRNRDIWLRICSLNRKLGRSRRRSKSFKRWIERQKSVFRVCFVTWSERRSKSKSWRIRLLT